MEVVEDFGYSEYPETTYGWLFFQINEYMHHSLEYILHYILIRLRISNDWVNIDNVVNDIKKIFYSRISDFFGSSMNINENYTLKNVMENAEKIFVEQDSTNISLEFLIKKIKNNDDTTDSLVYSLLILL